LAARLLQIGLGWRLMFGVSRPREISGSRSSIHDLPRIESKLVGDCLQIQFSALAQNRSLPELHSLRVRGPLQFYPHEGHRPQGSGWLPCVFTCQERHSVHENKFFAEKLKLSVFVISEQRCRSVPIERRSTKHCFPDDESKRSFEGEILNIQQRRHICNQ